MGAYATKYQCICYKAIIIKTIRYSYRDLKKRPVEESRKFRNRPLHI